MIFFDMAMDAIHAYSLCAYAIFRHATVAIAYFAAERHLCRYELPR